MERLLIPNWLIPSILLGIALAMPAPGLAASWTLAPQERVLQLGSGLEYLEDPEGTLSITDIRDPGLKADWRKSDQNTFNMGYTPSAYWIRFSLTLTATSTAPRLLEIAYPVLDYVDTFVFQEGHLLHHYQMGDRYPYEHRPIDHPNFLVPLELNPDETTEIYLRVQTSSSMQVPLALWRGDAFIENQYVVLVGQAAFYGAMVVMAIYNLFLFLSTRDISYFYYLMYVLSIAGLLAGIQGLTFKFLWPNALWFNDASLVVCLSGMVFFPALFFRNFLALQETRPLLSKILTVFALVSILTTILAFVLPYRSMMVVTIILALASIITAFYAGIQRWLDGYQAAKYLNLAWISVIIASLILALNKLGFLPRTWFTEHVAQLGAITEVMLLSFALAHRLNHERLMREQAQRESAEAQRRLLELQIKANEDLDRIVRERTEELERANAKLRELSSTDSLTGLFNRRAFEELFQKEYKRAYREKNALSVIMLDLDHFKKINDQHGHPFGDLCLSATANLIRQNIRRPPDIAARYGGEEFVILLPNTGLDGALCVARNILDAFAETFVEDGEIRLSLTASLGVACEVPNTQDGRDALLKEADQNLYAAKAGGRNRIEWRTAAPKLA